MNNTRNIPQSSVTRDTEESDGKTVRPNIEWPVELWKKVKIAAIKADASSPGQFVMDAMAEKLRNMKAA